VVVAHRLFESLEIFIDGVLLEEDFGRSRPHHHEPRTLVLALELFDLRDQLLGQIEFVLPRFDVVAVQTLHVVLIEDGFHRLDLLQRRLEFREQFFFEHARVHRRVVGGIGEDVPRAEDEIVQPRERDEILDRGRAILGALAETDRAHLRQAADRLGQSHLDCFDTRDERRAHRSEADEQHAELACRRSDLCPFFDCHIYLASSMLKILRMEDTRTRTPASRQILRIVVAGLLKSRD
jgi:hypothetical protein